MEIYFDCLPCFLRQVLEASRTATDDIDIQKKILKETAMVIADFESYDYSPEVGRVMHNIVKKYTGIDDPYREIKNRDLKAAEEAYPYLKHFLHKKNNRLYWALKISATGNVMDSALYKNIDIQSCIDNELHKEFTICDIERFESLKKNAKTILIIGDNAGETVFDRVLTEELLDMDITYAVRNGPIINDATLEDAYASKLNYRTKIISTGCNAPGVILKECSKEFLEIYNKADIVISKGQGNFETLSEQKRETFFLLKAKCPVIAKKIGVNINDYIFKNNTIG